MKWLSQNVKFVRASAPEANVATGASTTAVEVNASGYDRACFIFEATAQAGATKSSWALAVTHATASGGSFGAATNGSKSVGTSAGANVLAVLDVQVTPTKPFLKCTATVGTEGTSAIAMVNGWCVLYNGKQRPVAQSLAATVAVLA